MKQKKTVKRKAKDINHIINHVECYEPAEYFRLVDALDEDMEFGKNEENHKLDK